MAWQVGVDQSARNDQGIARITLREGAGEAQVVDFEVCGPIRRCRQPHDTVQDLVLLATSVYCLDRMVCRRKQADAWTRGFRMVLPVADPVRWGAVRGCIQQCLEFLTGDEWGLDLSSRLARPFIRPRRRRGQHRVAPVTGNAVCLFSGGLDSLIGAVNHLEADADGEVVLVGHYESSKSGPKSQQQTLYAGLCRTYPGRVSLVQVRAGLLGPGELSTRGRSLLFIALGMAVACALGADVPLLMPENGPIALNPPLTPSRRGSCSTRTAHPYFIKLVRELLAGLGLTNPLVLPLANVTKGEAVRQCANQDVLREYAALTVSCAKTGHKVGWHRLRARACGRCIPCIYRRAALHGADLDTEVYGNDICAGEVDVGPHGGDSAEDLRAMLHFLRKYSSLDEIASVLIGNGPLPPGSVLDAARLVSRAMSEVRQFIADKATAKIRAMAGV